MAVSPDDRFAGLINSSAERGGWVPGDVFTADTAGEEEPVEPRRVRLPVLVAVAIATLGVLVLAFFLLRPAPQHSATGAEEEAGQQAGSADDAAAGGEGTAGTGPGGTASAPPSGEVIVHVTGAVGHPSVVTLAAGARVQDAVEAAGGLKGDAAADSVNLARVLTDGEQIHIPEEGEDTGTDAQNPGTDAQNPGGTGEAGTNGTGGSAGSDGGDPGTAAESSGAGPGAAGQSGKVDLNTADATALQTLPGVGPVTAEAIISHRQTQPFAAVDDLLLVKGIGPKTFESLKDLVSVG
ncbi:MULTISPECIES: ComEA family DNA-binding protein [unclassified Brevibacterium]|jgi:competence protein ComEA|uniref:ComEA family DNA-binding protein n=1 Tax=unclassified Brevibacterium TaxID=2614124 RepID=UPI001BA77CFB|nr:MULTISPECIES: ComEA family DNA-binding protein [unclassified Brevibacterium]QUL80310.1 helix-hairpin-helix domain-containing protein [Brevibacterium sp. SMBL_HHYL_HB1]HJA59997.1 ComEA family DNA-binding protein [Candidatus Brevibacterium intestinavium]